MERCYVHHTTFRYNTISMAKRLLTLEVINEENLVANARNRGLLIEEGLGKLQKKYEMIKDVRSFAASDFKPQDI